MEDLYCAPPFTGQQQRGLTTLNALLRIPQQRRTMLSRMGIFFTVTDPLPDAAAPDLHE